MKRTDSRSPQNCLLTAEQIVQYNRSMTLQQQKLLGFIRNNYVHNQRGPTYSEMREFMKVGSNQAIRDWLDILERENYIQQIGGIGGVVPTEKGLYLRQERYQLGEMEFQKYDSPINIGGTADPYILGSINIASDDPKINSKDDFLFKGGENNGTT